MTRYRIKEVGHTVCGKKSVDDSITLKASKFQIGDFMDIAIKVRSFMMTLKKIKPFFRNHAAKATTVGVIVAVVVAIAILAIAVVAGTVHIRCILFLFQSF